jgi:hypothetical protein
VIVLSDSVALARPLNGPDLTATVTAFEQAKRGERDVEVRIGVGSLTGEIPLRVLGHAACLAEALRSDVFNFLSRPPQRMVLFSSAPKAGNRDAVGALRALVSLAGALRLKKVDFPIFLDLGQGTSGDSDPPSDCTAGAPRRLARARRAPFWKRR